MKPKILFKRLLLLLMMFVLLVQQGYAQTISTVLKDFNDGTTQSWTSGWGINTAASHQTATKYEGSGAITVGIDSWSASGSWIGSTNWSAYNYFIVYVYTGTAGLNGRAYVQYWNGSSWAHVESGNFSLTQNGWTKVYIDLNSGGIDKTQIGTYGFKNENGSAQTFLIDYAGLSTPNTNYYSKSTGDLSALATWGPNTDGSGTSPSNFTTANCVYNIRNNATPTIGAAWTVSGASSKVVVGDGTNACNFTIPSGFALSTPAIDVSNNGTLTIANTSIPTFGTLASGSTISYSGTGQTVTSTSYYNLTLANSSGTNTAGGNITSTGTFTTTSGGTFDMSTNALTVNTVSNGGTLKTANTSGTPITTGKTWGGTVEYNSGSNQTVMSGTYSNLTVSSGAGTNTASNTLTVNGNLSVASGEILDMSTFTLSGTVTPAISGTFKTSSTSATCVPSGKTWGGTFQYGATGGSQTIIGGTYNNLTILSTSGNNTASASFTVNGTFTTTSGGNLNTNCGITITTSSTFTNAGTITGPTTVNNYTRFVNSVSVSNSGTIGASSSYLAFSSTITGGTTGGNVLQSSSQAARCALTYYTRTLSGNWSDPNTWSTASCNGAAATSYPGQYDIVEICSANSAIISLDIDVTCAKITINGYDSRLNLNSRNLNVTGDVSLTTQTSRIYGTGSSNTLTIGGNFSATGYGAYIDLSGHDVSIGGNVSLNTQSSYISVGSKNLTITGNFDNTAGYGAQINWSTGTVTIGGNVNVRAQGGIQPFNCSSTGWLIMNGASKIFTLNTEDITIPRFRLGSSTITKAGGSTLTISTDFDMNNKTAFTQSAGSMTISGTISNADNMVMAYSGTPTFTHTGGGTIAGGSYYNLTTTTTAIYIPCNRTVTVANTFTNSTTLTGATSAGTWSKIVNANTISNSGTVGSGTSYLALSGTITGGTVTGNGTNVLQSSAQTATCVAADVLLASASQVADGDVMQNSLKNVIYKFTLAVTTTDATLNRVDFTTSGDCDATDLARFQLWYKSGSDDLSTALQVGTEINTSLGAGTHSFASFTRSIPNATTGYFYITADFNIGAVAGHTIQVTPAITTGELYYVLSNESGTATVGGVQTVITAVPTVVLASASPSVANASLCMSSTKNPIHKFTLAVTVASATLNQVDFSTTNSAAADITKYQLWYKATDDLSTATKINPTDITTGLGTGAHSFTGLTQVINFGTTGYLWITTDVAAAGVATAGNTIIVSASADASKVTFASASKSGSTSAGGTQTIGGVVTLASPNPAVATANLCLSTNSNQVYYFTLASATCNTTVTQVNFNTAGTYVASTDVTNFKLWYSSSSTFGSAATISTITTNLDVANNPHSFASLSQSITAGSTGYFWITADIKATAVSAHTLSVNALGTGDLTVTGSTKSAGSVSAGGTQTIGGILTLASPNPSVAVGTIGLSSTKNGIFYFTVAAGSCAATLNSVAFTSAGSYQATDVTKFQLYYNTTNNLTTASPIGTDITSSLGTGSHTFSGLTQAISSGSTGYFWITTDVDAAGIASRNISVNAIATGDLTFASGNKTGSTSAGGAQTISLADIAISSANPAVANGSPVTGSNKNAIYKFTTAITTAPAIINQINFTTDGTYASTDITKFTLWYNTVDNFGTATPLGTDITTSLGKGAHSFTGLSQSTVAGATGYFWIAVNVDVLATVGNTIYVSPAIAIGDLTYVSGNKTGTAFVGGTQTFTACAATTFYSMATGNASSMSNWNSAADGTGCSPDGFDPSYTLIIQDGHTITANCDIDVYVIIVGNPTGTGAIFEIGNSSKGSARNIRVRKSTGTALEVKAGAILRAGAGSGADHILEIDGDFVNSGTSTLISGTDHVNTFFGGTTTIIGNAVTFNDLTINAGSSLTAGNMNHIVYGNFSKNATGTFTPNCGTFTFSAAGAQSLPGSATTFDNLTFNGSGIKTINAAITLAAGACGGGHGTFTNGSGNTVNTSSNFTCVTASNTGTFDISGSIGSALTVSGTWTQNNGSYLKLGCSYSFGTLSAATATNHVVYQCQNPSTTTQMVDCNYNNLDINTIDSTSIVNWNGGSSRDIINLSITSGKFKMNAADVQNSGGTITVSGSQSVFEFNNASTYGSVANINITNGGKISTGTWAGGTMFRNVTGTITVDGAGSKFENRGQIGNASISGGITVSNGGAFTNTAGSRLGEGGGINGLVNVTGGTLIFAGYAGNFESGITQSGGTITIPSGGDIGIIKTRLDISGGTFDLQSGGNLDRVEQPINLSGGTLNINGSVSMTDPSLKGLNQTGGTSNWCSTTNPLVLGDGTVQVTGGQMNVNCNRLEVKNVILNITGTGGLDVAAGAFLAFKWGATGFIASGNANVVNDGSILYENDALNNCDFTITTAGTFTNNGVIRPATHASRQFIMNNAAGTFVNNGYLPVSNFNLTSGTFANFCKVYVSGNFSQSGGDIIGPYDTIAQTGYFDVTGTSTWSAGNFGGVSSGSSYSSRNNKLDFWDRGNPAAHWDTKGGGLTAGPNTSYGAFPGGVYPMPETGCTVRDIVLPIDLISFTGYCTNSLTELHWVTFTEVNNDKFYIERSTDGKNYEVLYYVNGAGNSNTRIDYTSTDIASQFGVTYYRLTQVDYDGQFETFPVIAVSCESELFMAKLNIVPNPIENNTIQFSLDGIETQSLLISIIDEYGRTFYQGSQEIQNNQLTSIPLNNTLATGIYFMRVTSSRVNLIEKIFVK